MRRTVAVIALAAVMAAGGASIVHAEVSASLRIDKVDVSDHPSVTMIVTAPAAEQAPRFTLTENGAERAVRAEPVSSADLEVLLVIDTTGSMAGAPLRDAQEASNAFLDALPATVPVAVMSYDTSAYLLTDFAADRDAHRDAIAGLSARGRTATHDAVIEAAEHFGDSTRVIILLTDGEDNASVASLDEAVGALLDAEVTLHGIAYRTAYSDESAVQRLATATGGTISGADDPAALTGIYTRIASELVSRHRLTYDSRAHGATRVEVSVEHDGQLLTSTASVTMPPAPTTTDEAPAVVDAEPAPVDDSAALAAAPPSWRHPALLVGAALWFLALGTVTLAMVHARGQRRVTGALARQRRQGSGSVAEHANKFAERALERRGRLRSLSAALEEAGLNIRPGEFVTLSACLAVVVLAVGELVAGWMLGVGLAIAALVVPRTIVTLIAHRRRARFADQLADVLQLLAGSLRAGYSFMQAVDAVAREADPPASEEFSRMVAEERLGRSGTEAMQAIAQRMRSQDFEWVAQAVDIHRQVGGDLAEVLDTVGKTIRQRARLHRQVRALTAEGRLSAMILVALPFGVAGVIWMSSPDYLAELTRGGVLGWAMLAGGTVLLTTGVFWLRSLVKLDY
jgi:tight adherence protein B